ncbi:hypothetical protein CW304_13940 [Bacillus sp. UFRGS-B20]|nr:hypothetical protein CW304_13940 [Bacillus sp. UFRGS-B20]
MKIPENFKLYVIICSLFFLQYFSSYYSVLTAFSPFYPNNCQPNKITIFILRKKYPILPSVDVPYYPMFYFLNRKGLL